MTKKRSITDEEIALIKAMTSRGMKNKDIQFFFNRPDRPVNSGRITGINAGKYGDSKNIPAATDPELDSFLASAKNNQVTPATALSSENSHGTSDLGPLSDAFIKATFKKINEDSWVFAQGESETHECKEDFGFKHASKWLRAVAALANNRGGYIFFGVKDALLASETAELTGLEVSGLKSPEFETADPADFTNRVKSTFDPTPSVETRLVKLGDKKIGAMYVHQHRSRPVIAVKGDGEQVKEGDIFFRYPGQSNRIKYSDLRAILDERDREARQQILPLVEKLLALGPRNAMVADLSTGSLSDSKGTILISEDLLQQINFIREGEFSEKSGEPTLKLVGDVQILKQTNSILHKSFATPTDLVKDFLSQKSPYDPKDYVRCAVEVSNGAWLPMHFYATKAGLDRAALAEFIHSTNAPDKRKAVYAGRALGISSAYQKAGGGATIALKQIQSGKRPAFKKVSDAADVARAISGLPEIPELPLEDLLGVLRDCWELIEVKKPGWLSFVRKAVARVDELYFAKPLSEAQA